MSLRAFAAEKLLFRFLDKEKGGEPTSTPVEEAFGLMGDAALSVSSIERVVGVDLSDNAYNMVRYPRHVLRWAREYDMLLVPSCCTLQHLIETAGGLIQVPKTLLEKHRSRRAFVRQWSLVSVHYSAGEIRTPRSLATRSFTPPLPVYLMASYLEIVLRNKRRLMSPRRTNEELDGLGTVLYRDDTKGCPVLRVGTTQLNSPIPKAVAWTPAPLQMAA